MAPNPTLLLHTKRGPFFLPEGDFYVRAAFARTGDYSPGELRLLKSLLRQGDIFLDVGAHIGTLSIPLADHVGFTGKVIAFEPQRGLFQILCANAVVNGCSNIEAHWAGVGSEEGQMWIEPLDPQTRNYGARRLLASPALAAEAARVMTLDSLPIARCDLIKIDVEGMEEQVFEGATRLLASGPAIYFENSFISDTDGINRSSRLISHFLEQGYRLFWHCPPIVEAGDDESEDVLQDGGSFNVLALPEQRAEHLDRDSISTHDLREIKDATDIIYPSWLSTATVTASALQGELWIKERQRGFEQSSGAQAAARCLVYAMNAAASNADIADRLVEETALAWSLADIWLVHFEHLNASVTTVVASGTLPPVFLAFLRERMRVIGPKDTSAIKNAMRNGNEIIQFIGPDYGGGHVDSGKVLQLHLAASPLNAAMPDWKQGPAYSVTALR